MNSLRETSRFHTNLLHFDLLWVDRVTICAYFDTGVQGDRSSKILPLDTLAQVNKDCHQQTCNKFGCGHESVCVPPVQGWALISTAAIQDAGP